MIRVPATPSLISWACKRSGQERKNLMRRFKKLPEWESGKLRPTAIQLKEFARLVHVPYSYMFLDTPPKEKLPIKDFRTKRSEFIGKASPNLLDVIYTMQNRQDWYRWYATSEQFSKIKLIGSVKTSSSPEQIAQDMRKQLKLDLVNDNLEGKKVNRLNYLVSRIEKQGILVMISGIVDDDKSRKLNLDEFRGFTLCDPIAPLIFVNGQDTQSAQLFTLAHEFAHLLLKNTGIFDSEPNLKSDRDKRNEVWCNKFAAELLVPSENLKQQLKLSKFSEYLIKKLAKYYGVSKQVILYRLQELRQISRPEYEKLRRNLNRELVDKKLSKSGSGNDMSAIYNQVGQKFASAVIKSTIEGQTLYRDAYSLLGILNIEMFNKLAVSVGVKI